MKSLLVSALVLAAVGLAACPAPKPTSGALTCSSSQNAAERCPKNYQCQVDNKCYPVGEQPVLDLAAPVDLAGQDLLSREGECRDLCGCLKDTCNGIGAVAGTDDNTSDCEEACLLNTTQDLPCRFFHCTNFARLSPPASAITHCPHARGQDPATCK